MTKGADLKLLPRPFLVEEFWSEEIWREVAEKKIG
jgi:hypothetical protein